MKARTPILAIFAQATLSGFAAVLSLAAPVDPHRGFITLCLSIVALSLAGVFLTKLSEPRPRNWVTIDVMFSLAFSVIHFSYITYWLLDFFLPGTEIWYFRRANCPASVNRGIAMFASCMCGLLAGYYAIPVRRWRARLLDYPIPPALLQQWGALGRFIVRGGFIAFAVFLVLVGPGRFFGVYGGSNVFGFLPNILYQLGQVLSVAGIAVVMAARQSLFIRIRRRGRLLGFGLLDLSLVALTIVAIGIHGDRSTLMYVFVGFLIALNEYSKPLTFKTLSVMGLATVFALGFIVTVRSAREGNHSWDPLENINKALLNLGTSSLCGYVAIDYVPLKHDYYLGQLQTRDLAGILPFGRRLLGVEDSPDNSSSKLMTTLIQGVSRKGVAGTGTSVFADLYLSFGFLGTLGLFLAIGMMSKYIQNQARLRVSLNWQVAYICYATFLTLVSRYAFLGGFIRFVLYAVLYLIAAALFLGIRTRYALPLQVEPRRVRSPAEPADTAAVDG